MNSWTPEAVESLVNCAGSWAVGVVVAVYACRFIYHHLGGV
jgi:hypothetical protein